MKVKRAGHVREAGVDSDMSVVMGWDMIHTGWGG